MDYDLSGNYYDFREAISLPAKPGDTGRGGPYLSMAL
jgi:hypothetical protein